MPSQSTYIKQTSFEDFDPNKLIGDKPLWGVFDSVHFKTFTGRGPALLSFMTQHQAKLYELTHGGWHEWAVMDKAKPPSCCSWCKLDVKQSWQSPRYTNYNPWQRKAFQFKREFGKVVSPPELLFLCKTCSSRNR